MARDVLGASVPPEVFVALGSVAEDDAYAALAATQLFSAEAHTHAMRTELTRLVPDASPLRRLRIIGERVFLPRTELSVRYNFAPTAPPWTYASCYVRRFVDLIGRHRGAAVEFFAQPGPGLAEAATRKERLRKWLLAPGP